MGRGDILLGGNPVFDLHPIQGGVTLLSVALCYKNQDKLWHTWTSLARVQLYLPASCHAFSQYSWLNSNLQGKSEKVCVIMRFSCRGWNYEENDLKAKNIHFELAGGLGYWGLELPVLASTVSSPHCPSLYGWVPAKCAEGKPMIDKNSSQEGHCTSIKCCFKF